jgi:hypothetical protein
VLDETELAEARRVGLVRTLETKKAGPIIERIAALSAFARSPEARDFVED